MEKLTATEMAVARLAAEGTRNGEIAAALHVSEQRVKNALNDACRILALDPSKDRRVLLALLVERERDEREGC